MGGCDAVCCPSGPGVHHVQPCSAKSELLTGFCFRGIFTSQGENKEGTQVHPWVHPRSSESLPDERHEFLLALVYLLQVVYELCELNVSIVRHQKRLSGFAEELDELAVVARTDVCQP